MKKLITSAVNELRSVRPKRIRPYLAANILSVPVKMLYDTGADVSCISERMFRQIPVDQRPPRLPGESAQRFKAAGGHELSCKGRYLIPITVGKKQVEYPCFVIQNLSEEAILGYDFISDQNLSFDPDSRRFRWRNENPSQHHYRGWVSTNLRIRCSGPSLHAQPAFSTR